MQKVAYSEFREGMDDYARMHHGGVGALLILGDSEQENVIVMSEREHESLIETIRIFENPELHKKILRGMAQAKACM